MVWAPLMPSTPSRPQFFNMPLSSAFQRVGPRCWKGHSCVFLQNTSSSTNRRSAHSSLWRRKRDQLFHIPTHLRFPSELFWLAGICELYSQIKQLMEVSIKMLYISVIWQIILFHKGSVTIICQHIQVLSERILVSSLQFNHHQILVSCHMRLDGSAKYIYINIYGKQSVIKIACC